MATIELKPHQEEIVEMNPPRALIPDKTGTGKTIIGIALADKNCKRCLVVTIKDNVEKWENEIIKYSSNPEIYAVVSKETFKKYYNELPVYVGVKITNFDGVIWDECHHVAGAKSQLSKAFAKWLKTNDIKYRWLMSATPLTANWLSIQVLANHLGHNINYYKFMRTFFYEIKMGGRMVWKQNPKKEGQLQELIKRLALGRMVTMDDIAKVPEQKNITEYFHMTPQQKEAIVGLMDSDYIVRWTKTHQIENGTLKGNEYEPAKTFQCFKSFRIWELARAHPKIAIFCRYNAQIEMIKNDLSREGYRIYVINGANQDRHSTVQAIEADERCVVLINTACGTGYELPSIGVIVFASLSFSYLDYEQSRGRFLRVNKLKENTYYHLVTKGGVDEDVYDCIMDKKDFYIKLYDR